MGCCSTGTCWAMAPIPCGSLWTTWWWPSGRLPSPPWEITPTKSSAGTWRPARTSPTFPLRERRPRYGGRTARQNFVIAHGDGGGGGQQLTPEQARLGNPAPGSFQSGISVLSGWVCEADTVDLVFEPATGEPFTQEAGYGTERGDTAGVCGDTDNGFGLLFNWNLLGDGQHTVRAYADDEAFAHSTFTVTTLGEDFAEDLARTHDHRGLPGRGADDHGGVAAGAAEFCHYRRGVRRAWPTGQSCG